MASPATIRVLRRLSEEKASDLAKEAIDLSNAGDNEQALRKLREAASIRHSNADVQTAFQLLHSAQNGSPLADMCRRYAQYHDEQAGENAANFLKDHAPLSAEVAVESLKLLLDTRPTQLSDAQDTIIAELARQSLDVRQYLAMELQASATAFFDNIYERGDQAANCLRAVVLESSLWSDEAVRLRVEEDLFQLFLAKLMESGHDLDSRALKGIVLLLMADAPRLKDFVDEEGFDALMSSLDIQLPADVRGQATLVISKFLEVSEPAGQAFIQKFITSHVQRHKADDLVLAFSAAASLFPVASAGAPQLFMTEGFLPSIMPLLDRKLKGEVAHDAFLALLNAACMDATCRTSIAAHCSEWLAHKVSNGTERQNALAATVLAKLRTAGGFSPPEQRSQARHDDVSDLVDLFQSNLRLDSTQNLSNSVEGLAYTSLRPDIKEQLAKDASFLKRLLQVLESNSESPEIVLGSLSTIANVTQYPPSLSEEQTRISQLRSYASASKPSVSNPLEDESHVRERCTLLVSAGAVPTLVKIDKKASAGSGQLTDRILLSLSRNPQDRGRLAQQGAVKLLISHFQRSPQPDPAHALARILISLNPALVFPASTTPHITDAIPPLVSLLQTPSTDQPPTPLSPSPSSADGPIDLLPIFESLLALTNLASTPDRAAATGIVRHATAFNTLADDLLLSPHRLIRRAAVELLCNLCTCPAGIEKFADGSSQARRRLHLLLAMADVEDLPTRTAAGGALAMLTEFREVVGVLAGFERWVEIVVALCREGLDESGGDEKGPEGQESAAERRKSDEATAGTRYRGLVVLDNVLGVDDPTLAAEVKRRVTADGDVMSGLREVLTSERARGTEMDVQVIRQGMAVLRKLQT